MILRSVRAGLVSDLVVGILTALGLPVRVTFQRQRVSPYMFRNAVSKLVRTRPLHNGDSVETVREFLRFMHSVSNAPIDAPECVSVRSGSIRIALATCAITIVPTELGADLEVRADGPDAEVLILMNWMCLDFDLSRQDVTIENRTLSIGLWAAAKLYESAGDLAGKAATIDEAIDLR